MGNIGSYVIAIAPICMMFCAAYACAEYDKYRRGVAEPDSDGLLAPLLLSGNRIHVYRLEAATRDAQAGFRRCLFCRFENYKRTPFCKLCGAEVHDETRHMDVKRSVPAWTTLTQRQKRARIRKEWLRKMDIQGQLFWFRQSRSQTTRSHTPKHPGFVVQFVTNTDTSVQAFAPASTSLESAQQQPSSPSKVTIEVIPPDTEADTTTSAAVDEAPLTPPTALDRAHVVAMLTQTAAQLTIVLTETSATDASLPPLTDALTVSTASIATATHMTWKQTLVLATQDFPTKYAQFVAATAPMRLTEMDVYVLLTIRRSALRDDSIEALSVIPQAFVRSVMRIAFAHEAGVDAGALQREWFGLLNQALVDSASSVFVCVDAAEQVYYLNTDSHYVMGENHLLHYYGAGRLVGRTLLEGQVLGFHLALPLLKLILGQPVTLSDLEFLDAAAYKSLVWIQEHDGVDALGLTFSVMQRRNGQLVEIDLVPNGRDIDVTDANKHEYLQHRFRYTLFESVASQLYAFLKGVYEVVAFQNLVLFDPEELDYVLCGSDDIDVSEWERHTLTSASLLKESRVTYWFWDIVRAMPNEQRRRLLRFATGSSRVPLGGFSALTSVDGRLCLFTLKGVPMTTSAYIASRACFNRLDVPLYETRGEMELMLQSIVAADEFGFTRA